MENMAKEITQEQAQAMLQALKWAWSTLTDRDEEDWNETDKATIEMLANIMREVENS